MDSLCFVFLLHLLLFYSSVPHILTACTTVLPLAPKGSLRSNIMYTLARHSSLFVVFGSVSFLLSLFLIWDYMSVPDFPSTLATRYQYHYDTTASDHLYTTHTMGNGARGTIKNRKGKGSEGDHGWEMAPACPLLRGGTGNPERPALSGIPTLCGTKMTEAALSILCNVSCHQN